MSKPKQKLIPLKVPWRVSAAISEIRLVVEEHDATLLSFSASVLPSRYVKPFKFSDYSVIEMTFSFTFYTRTYAGELDVSKYDWRDVIPAEILELLDENHRVADIALWGERAEKWHQQWVETNICGEPGVYEVENSEWIAESRGVKHGEFRHFLIIGHDMYVEIIAREYKWETRQADTSLKD